MVGKRDMGAYEEWAVVGFGTLLFPRAVKDSPLNGSISNR